MHRARRSSTHGLVIAMIVGVAGLVPVDTTADGQFTFDPCSCDLNHDHFVGLGTSRCSPVTTISVPTRSGPTSIGTVS